MNDLHIVKIDHKRNMYLVDKTNHKKLHKGTDMVEERIEREKTLRTHPIKSKPTKEDER